MTHLDCIVEYDTLVARGALDLRSDEQIRSWMGGRDKVPVAEALKTPAPAEVIFYAVLREYLVGAHVLHQMAIDVAAEFTRRYKAQGVYVDYRFEYALSAKQNWLDGRISDGELTVATATARRAATDVAEHEDSRARAVGQRVCEALLTDPDEAVSRSYYAFLKVYTTRDDRDWLVNTAKRRLGE